MKFTIDDEDAPDHKIAGLDVSEIAAMLAQASPEGDAYDILRDVLTTLGEQARERRSSTH